VLQPFAGFDLPDILHSWKSYTAKLANRLLTRTGEFWQAEYYDHLIRGDEDLLHAVECAWLNPEKAGLSDWKWRGKSEELIEEVLNDGARRGGTGDPPVSSIMNEENH